MKHRVAAYLAAAWALAFAAPHVYWATGRKEGLDTALSQRIVDDAGVRFALGCASIALFCACGAVVALATVHRFPRRGARTVRRTLVGLVWFAAALLLARSAMIFIQFSLVLTGVTHIASSDRADFLHMARWFMFLWLPWFALGAVAWTRLAWRYAHAERTPSGGDEADAPGRVRCGVVKGFQNELAVRDTRNLRGNTGYTHGMAKVMVSLPDDVLRAVDVEADRRGTTRSGLLRELAENSFRRRSTQRAERMAQIRATGGRGAGHGGHAAELVKATRPER